MIRITKAKPGECQLVRQFEEKIWQEKCVTSQYDAAIYVRFGYVFIAKDKGKIVGAIIALRTKDNEVKITDWIVDKEYRRKGIGGQLYQKLEKEVADSESNIRAGRKQGSRMIACVKATNIASLEGHKKFGFKKIKKMIDPFCLGDKKTWWLMATK